MKHWTVDGKKSSIKFIIYSYVRVHKHNNTNHFPKLQAIANVEEEEEKKQRKTLIENL